MSVLSAKELVNRCQQLPEEQRQRVLALIGQLRRRQSEATAAGAAYTHRAVGRLLFAGEDRPLHHMAVELWVSGFLQGDRLLGRAATDGDGRFEIPYIAPEGESRRTRKLELRVFDHQIAYAGTGEPTETQHLVYQVEQEELAPAGVHDFGSLEVHYWHYDNRSPLARVRVAEGGEPPQMFVKARQSMAHKLIAEVSLRRTTHLMASKIDPSWPPLRQVQRDYPPNLTIRLEQERPGCTRTDEYLGERALNGFHPLLLSRDRSHPGWYRIHWNWDACELNGDYELPNVDARFELRGEQLYPVQLSFQFRAPGGTAPHSPLQPAVTYTPADGERWEQAKRLFRSVYLVAGETDQHLCQTHLNAEQFAVAAWRNLRRNPLRYLLFPHLKEAVTINWRGDQLIFGQTGIMVRASGLTAGGLLTRFTQRMAFQDWKGWRPRQPLTPRHTFALAGQLYWEVLTAHIERFFQAHRDEISRYWLEVHRFSRDLVEHSVPYAPLPPDELDDWPDRNELDKPEIPRVEAGGVLRSVRPITASDTPTDADIANLKEACRFILFQATFVHSYTNSRQYQDGGELMYASLGLRNGGLGPESDLNIAPRPAEATDTLFLGRYLSELRYGIIMKNEDGDVPPQLIQLLFERKADFAAIGFDVDEIASRTNV